jgi:hypothetical protein
MASAIVRAKEVHHEEEVARRAAADLRVGVCDGREWNRTYSRRPDETVGDRADRARLGWLSLVLRIEFVPHCPSVRGQLPGSLRGDLLSRGPGTRDESPFRPYAQAVWLRSV